MNQQTDSLQMPQIKQSTQASYQRNAEVDEVREYLTFYWFTSTMYVCAQSNYLLKSGTRMSDWK